MEDDNDLEKPFEDLLVAFQSLRQQVIGLAKVQQSIDELNSVFGAFQQGMEIHSSCLQYPDVKPIQTSTIQYSGIPVKSNSTIKQQTPPSTEAKKNVLRVSGIPKPRASIAKSSLFQGDKSSTTTPRRHAGSKIQMRKKTQTKQSASGMQLGKSIRENVPRKYQSKEEFKKLETILLYLKNRKSGVTIADLVKHSGLPAIKSKEILQTLMKMELIDRSHDRKIGFLYSYGKQN